MSSRTFPAVVDALKPLIEAHPSFDGTFNTGPAPKSAPNPTNRIQIFGADVTTTVAALGGGASNDVFDEDYVIEGTIAGRASSRKGTFEPATKAARDAAAELLDVLDETIRNSQGPGQPGLIPGAKHLNVFVETADWLQGHAEGDEGTRVCVITFGIRVRARI